MNSNVFTDDEKRFISLYTYKRATAFDTIFHYGVYILPSLLFACYSVWNKDFIAALVAYIALFVIAVLYISNSAKYSSTLRSILEKYEAISSTEKAGVEVHD